MKKKNKNIELELLNSSFNDEESNNIIIEHNDPQKTQKLVSYLIASYMETYADFAGLQIIFNIGTNEWSATPMFFPISDEPK